MEKRAAMGTEVDRLAGKKDPELRDELNHRRFQSRRKSAQSWVMDARSSDGSVNARRAPSGRSTKRRQPGASEVASGLGSGKAMLGGKVKKVVCGLR
jgi:hypothetical protein